MTGNLYDHRRLAALREEKGFSQQYLADKLGVNKVTFSRVENGHNVSYELLLRLCQLLDVDSSEILYSSRDVEIAA